MRLPLSDLLSPHYCCSCGELGRILCEYCKYDIVSEPFQQCLVCHAPVAPVNHLCSGCKVAYRRAWCVGQRSEALRQLIDNYKFERARAAHVVLAELLEETLPQLPNDVVVVPIPTVAPHRRVRGYGHVELVAERFARQRGLPYRETLSRCTNSVQRGASRVERIERAKTAFRALEMNGETVLLIDDVYTTGATEVWIATLSRQPLEK